MIPLRDVNPTGITPVLTLALIAINAFVFFAIQPQDGPEAEEFVYEYAAIACELTTGDPLDANEINTETCSEGATSGSEVFPDKNVYLAALTSMFLHGGLLHLLGNMWFLWIFGNNIEEAFGRPGFLLMYVASGLAATAGFVLFNTDSAIPLIGASGAVAGVMGSYLVLFPTHRILTIIFFVIVGVPSVIFLGIWFLGQFALVGADSNIAWEAHVFGFLFGALLTLPIRRALLRRTNEGKVTTLTF